MSALSDIDKIVVMFDIMEALKIPFEGLKTLDEMRQRVKETLGLSEKRLGWTAKEVGILQFLFKILATTKCDF